METSIYDWCEWLKSLPENFWRVGSVFSAVAMVFIDSLISESNVGNAGASTASTN